MIPKKTNNLYLSSCHIKFVRLVPLPLIISSLLYCQIVATGDLKKAGLPFVVGNSHPKQPPT